MIEEYSADDFDITTNCKDTLDDNPFSSYKSIKSKVTSKNIIDQSNISHTKSKKWSSISESEDIYLNMTQSEEKQNNHRSTENLDFLSFDPYESPHMESCRSPAQSENYMDGTSYEAIDDTQNYDTNTSSLLNNGNRGNIQNSNNEKAQSENIKYRSYSDIQRRGNRIIENLNTPAEEVNILGDTGNTPILNCANNRNVRNIQIASIINEPSSGLRR